MLMCVQAPQSVRMPAYVQACGFVKDKEPLTCGGFIFPHIHIGLILSLSHASENPGSRALSGPLLS